MNKLNLKKVFSLILFTLTVVVSAQNFGAITYSHATNISGKQRMLSQRMTKIYLQRLSGKTEKLNKQYQESLVEFNENFATLEKNAANSNDQVKQAITAEKKEWENFLQTFLFNKKPNMATVVTQATDLLKICNNLVVQIEAEAKGRVGSSDTDLLKVQTVNISGKQRMLSQRFSMLYLACGIEGNKSTVFCKQYMEVFGQIKATWSNLIKNKLNTADIISDLNAIKELIDSIDSRKEALIKNTISPVEISEFSNKLTKKYNDVTGKYAKL